MKHEKNEILHSFSLGDLGKKGFYLRSNTLKCQIKVYFSSTVNTIFSGIHKLYTVKLGNKERFDKEQIGIKEPVPVTNLPFTS